MWGGCQQRAGVSRQSGSITTSLPCIGTMMKKISTTRPNEELIWAIRLGEFVELRQANQLVKKVSKLTVKTKVEKRSAWGYAFYPTEYVTEPVTLKQVTFTGGEVLGYMKVASFRRVFHFTPMKDDAEKLDKHMRAIVQKAEWRRRNLR